MLEVEATAIPEVKVLTPRRFSDERGFFSEVYNRARLAEAGISVDFVQDNHSWSATVGTLRGLHFQIPPFAQAKLVRVSRGRILDVAVDIRRSSATYGRSVVVELSAENWCQLYIPVGFAHGLCTLEPDTEVLYKVSAPYSAAHDYGLAWDDPALGLEWPLPPDGGVVADRDRRHPRLRDLPAYFE